MQPQPKSKLYKKLLIGSVALFALGLLIAFVVLSNLYGDADKCGFGAGTCSSANTHGTLVKVGSTMTLVGFYAGLVFLILFLVARSKEKKTRQ
jgi:Sec-independent protein secretion pathway component TatC